MTATPATLAAEARAFFITRQRDNGDTFTATIDATPEWVADMIREAHADHIGDFLPDDRRYLLIRDALDFIEEQGDAASADDCGDFADSAVDVYTSDRIAWLASHLDRLAYCDAAQDYMGADAEGGIADMIGMGQYMEASLVYASVFDVLEDRAAALECAS